MEPVHNASATFKHSQAKGWRWALQRTGASAIAAASSLEVDGHAGALLAAAKQWAHDAGLPGYPIEGGGGFCTVKYAVGNKPRGRW